MHAYWSLLSEYASCAYWKLFFTEEPIDLSSHGAHKHYFKELYYYWSIWGALKQHMNNLIGWVGCRTRPTFLLFTFGHVCLYGFRSPHLGILWVATLWREQRVRTRLEFVATMGSHITIAPHCALPSVIFLPMVRCRILRTIYIKIKGKSSSTHVSFT